MAMNADAAIDGDDLLSREQAAKYLSIRPQTLAVWRCTGRYSVPFVKIGRSVRYRRHDLDEFIERRTATSTAELVAKRNHTV